MNSIDTTPALRPDAVVVLGRGGTGAASRQSLTDLAEALRQAMPADCTVVTAFVDKAAPSLPEALQLCLPARSIVVLPLFSPDEPALLRCLHKLAMRWRTAQPDQEVQVRFAEPLQARTASRPARPPAMWWITHNAHGAFAARGVHGQTIYIDPKAQMVIARFTSHPVAGNAANDPTSLPAYEALGRHLMGEQH